MGVSYIKFEIVQELYNVFYGNDTPSTTMLVYIIYIYIYINVCVI
jgi:hypothetical protein